MVELIPINSYTIQSSFADPGFTDLFLFNKLQKNRYSDQKYILNLFRLRMG